MTVGSTAVSCGMSKVIKILLALVATVVLLLVVGVIVLIMSVNALAKKGIETAGTYAMGVPTTLDSASIGLLSGKVGISGLNIANPAGYKGKQFFALGQGDLAISASSLQGDVIEVPLLSLSDISISLEKQGDKANYQVIMDNLAKLSSKSDTAPKPAADGGPEKRLIINDLVIKNVKVHAELIGGGNALTDIAAKATQVDVTIPDIRLQNVGKAGSSGGGGGVTVSQLSGIVMEAILVAVANNTGNLLPADLLGDLKGNLGKLGDLSKLADTKALGDLGKVAGDKAGEALTGSAGKAEKAVEDLTKKVPGLGGLIPGQKKDEKK